MIPENSRTYEKLDLLDNDKYSYGFNNRYKEIFVGQEDLLADMCEFSPLMIERKDRLQAKKESELEAFDPERYAFDNFDQESLDTVQELMSYQTPIEQQLQNLSLDETLTPKEQELLTSIKP